MGCIVQDITRQQLNDAAYQNKAAAKRDACILAAIENGGCLYLDGTTSGDTRDEELDGGSASSVMYDVGMADHNAYNGCA